MPCEAIGAARFAETRLVCETRRSQSRRAARHPRAGLGLGGRQARLKGAWRRCLKTASQRFRPERTNSNVRPNASTRGEVFGRAGLRLTSIDGEVRHPAWSRNRNRLTRQWRPGETGMCHRAVSFPDPLHLLGYPLIGFRAEAKSDRLPQKRKRLADQNLLAPNPERW